MTPREVRSWAAWMITAATSFFLLEGRALRAAKRGLPETPPTLTACLRYWLGITPSHARRHLLRPVFASLVLWFWGHILYGWPWPFDRNARLSERIRQATQVRR